MWLCVWGQIDLGSTQQALIVKCQHHIKMCHIDPPSFQHITPTTLVLHKVWVGFCIITWASVRFSLDASNTLSGPTMYWVLKYKITNYQYQWACLSFTCWIHPPSFLTVQVWKLSVFSLPSSFVLLLAANPLNVLYIIKQVWNNDNVTINPPSFRTELRELNSKLWAKKSRSRVLQLPWIRIQVQLNRDFYLDY